MPGLAFGCNNLLTPLEEFQRWRLSEINILFGHEGLCIDVEPHWLKFQF